ncbi:MAG TPA: hypothetical protein VFE85_08700 [Woeseiaceae bacterium]|nr:hypothetical protein [Woeseiaceae bacterium]
MFVGHYAASLALKTAEKRASLGVLFLAVQFLDVLFFPFVLLGIERLKIVENFTPSTHFELVYMPYTHSLLAAVLWAGAAYLLFRWVFVKRRAVALVVAAAVFSHWILDLLVHTPDLPLWRDASPKLGLGLWQYPYATFALEAALLLTALWLYLRGTRAVAAAGKYGMAIFVVLLILVNAVNIFGPLTDDSPVTLAVTALGAYGLFAVIAFWLDSKRA